MVCRCYWFVLAIGVVVSCWWLVVCLFTSGWWAGFVSVLLILLLIVVLYCMTMFGCFLDALRGVYVSVCFVLVLFGVAGCRCGVWVDGVWYVVGFDCYCVWGFV